MERRRRRTQAFKWLVGLALLFAGAGFMFVSGQEVANQRVSRLERDIDALTAKVEALGKENAGLKASLAASKAEVRQWQDRYANDVPSGDGKELYAQVMGRLKQGVSAKRLGFVITAAEEKRDCPIKPQTKRFAVRTKFYDGAADAVTFAEGAITVTAQGEPAKNRNGAPQAWFDSDRPLKLSFARLGGKSDAVDGTLPLHHALVIDNIEHRFSVHPADLRGFVQVTAIGCKYP